MNVYDARALAASAVNAHADRPATALVHDSVDARVVIFRIGPGQAVPVHTSTSTVLLMIVSGAGSVMGPGGDRSVKSGDIVAYDAQEPHGMRAGLEELIVAAVIAPRPGAA
ncbi:MAG: cupin domain-containing protein [Gemmatimonadaceae bacterium]